MLKRQTIILLLFNILQLNSQKQNKTISVLDKLFTIEYSKGLYDLSIKMEELEKDVVILKLKIDSENKFTPENISIKWSVPSNNIAGYWTSKAFLNKTINPDWGPSKVISMLAREAPVLSLFSHDDKNKLTFAISDALNTTITSTAIKEEEGIILNEIKLFSEKTNQLNEYEIQIRIDQRNIHFTKAINEVSKWWETFKIYEPAFVPKIAKQPVYSTWYSYHQTLSEETIYKECQLAKTIGYKTVIVDDGWQTLDSNRGYAFTGDWKPERLKKIKELIDKIHALDMKFVLWYAVPFVGEKSEAYNLLKGKFLKYWKEQGTYVLDPRYPDVRDYIINTYATAVKDWNLDGLKLDFIGNFKANDSTLLTIEQGRDYASVNLATDRLMYDLIDSLRKIKNDIIIEFRQPYTGPLMRKYGNMLRASDCPNVALINRVETTDLKLLSGNTPVHSDMLMWNKNESVEIAALQFLNIIYSVPQISVRLEEIPEEHFKMIRFFTNYWIQNRQILLEGDFTAHHPLHNYPYLESESIEKKIITLYSNIPIQINTNLNKNWDIINAKTDEQIFVNTIGKKKKYFYSIYNCKGELIKKQKITLKEGVSIFKIPKSGLIQFTQNKN